jgi:AraC-like DNA-binding protein
MQLDYYLPTPRGRSLFSIHAVVDEVREDRVEALPAMLANIYIVLRGKCAIAMSDTPMTPLAPVSLIGPSTRAYRVKLFAGCRIAVVGLLPLGWIRLMRLSGAQCADQLFDGRDIWGPSTVERLSEQLVDTALDGSHIETIEAAFSPPARPISPLALEQICQIDHWLEQSPALDLDVLAQNLGLGQRQIRRIALEFYGASPKTLAMKYRALRLAAQLTHRGATASEAYADQSHMIRDFRRFLGWTPAAYLKESANIAAATMAGRRQAGAQRPLVLLS